MQISFHLLESHQTRLRTWRISIAKLPYWRLYWNSCSGASVIHDGKAYPLNENCVVLIAPQTEFASDLSSPVDHFYLHFQLSAPFDRARSGVFSCPASGEQTAILHRVVQSPSAMERKSALLQTHVLAGFLSVLPEDIWLPAIDDPRFGKVLRAMSRNRERPLANARLAEIANMAPTAFIRRFRQIYGMPPQAYYMQKRLEHACLMLEYEEQTLEAIAEACGFCDRSYFSTVFRKHTGCSPAAFRKEARKRG